MTRSVVPKEYRRKPFGEVRSAQLIVNTWFAVSLLLVLVVLGLVALVAFLVVCTDTNAYKDATLVAMIALLVGLIGVILKSVTRA